MVSGAEAGELGTGDSTREHRYEARIAAPRSNGASPSEVVGLRHARPIRARVADISGRSAEARLVLSLGPVTVMAGLVWALLQPYRITFLDPHGESFWWLAVQPPLLVALAGVVFHLAVARGLVRDLSEAERRRRSDP